ncbi:MAG: hypothetical protein ACI9U2_001638 [Bradymonadia bacterium]|jgi:hypothetical protein
MVLCNMRLLREPSIERAQTSTVGRVGVGVGLLICVLAFVEHPAFILVGAGIALTSAAWWLNGLRRSRRPVHYLDVDATGVTLMPERIRHTHAALGALLTIDWSREVVGAMGMTVTRQRAGVHADAADVRLYIDETRSGCEAWLIRFEAARDGVAAQVALTALDAALEQPSPAVVAGVSGILGGAALAVVWAWLDVASWVVGFGAGCMVLAGCSAAMLIERRRLALGFGVLGAVGLWAKPIVAPAMVMLPDGLHALGVFAEVHLGCVVGGVLALVGAWVMSRTASQRLR